jgi:protein phosphatase inhibitor 2
MTEKELTIHNTQVNAGHRRSSSAARPGGSRRQSSRTPSAHGGDAEAEESSQRLKWDEANIYLNEQDRTATMKINEPKTPYAKHYDPTEDPSDEDEAMGDGEGGDEIPGLSLGEPEEAVPEGEFGRRTSKVHVEDDNDGNHDTDDETVGMTPEEREKHRRFEQMRKKHYEMKSVAHLLGHPEDLDTLSDEEDDGGAPPPVPSIPNGSA